MQPYSYPASAHTRKHGPTGYDKYESYRDWLRDEFLFRCVYCLHRERWGRPQGGWHIDHWKPQHQHPEHTLDYDNLLYSCVACNSAKGARELADPCSCLLDGQVEVLPDGQIIATSKEARRTIRILGIDSPRNNEFRAQLIGIYQLRHADYSKFLEWMGYPTDLPDLSRKRCRNTRPEGVARSCFARRQRGELPDHY